MITQEEYQSRQGRGGTLSWPCLGAGVEYRIVVIAGGGKGQAGVRVTAELGEYPVLVPVEEREW